MNTTTTTRICLALFLSLAILPNWASAQVSPETVRLTQEMFQAYESKDFAKAKGIALKIVEAEPDNPVVLYNAACMSSLTGDTTEAIEWLAKAAEHGFEEIDLARNDKDLVGIRGEAGYTAALDKIEANARQSLAEFKKKIGTAEPVVVLPPGYDAGKPASLIVALHGFGQNADDIVDAWKDAAAKRGAILLAPRAVRKAGGGFQWGDVREADAIVMDAIERVKKQYKIKEGAVVLTGFSQGGFMAFNVGMRHATLFDGVIPVAGRFDRQLAQPPTIASTNLPRFYLIVGTNDEVYEQNKEAVSQYEKAGIAVKLAAFDALGHEFPPDREKELVKALDWILEK